MPKVAKDFDMICHHAIAQSKLEKGDQTWGKKFSNVIQNILVLSNTYQRDKVDFAKIKPVSALEVTC